MNKYPALFVLQIYKTVEKQVRNFIRDPFFHFFITALFIYTIQSTLVEDNEQKAEIKISKSEIKELKIKWQKEYDEEPSPSELKSLILKLSLDKMLFHEALSMGLHKEDREIFNKLVKKVKLLFANSKLQNIPDEKILQEYYEKHKDDYQKDAKISFSQVFVSIDQPNPIQKANQLYELLKENDTAPNKIDGVGDNFKPHHFQEADKDKIIKLFGKSFYKQINFLKPKQWHKPIISSKGVHIVYIAKLSNGEILPFKAVKDLVTSDYIEDMKTRHYKNKIKSIKNNYKIVHEQL